MAHEVTLTETQEDDLPSWVVRGVDMDIRYRMKVQAAIKQTTIGELVSRTLRSWLDSGAPDEQISREDIQ